MRRLIGYALIVASAAAFGAMAIFIKIAYRSGADPITILFLRFPMAAGALLVLMALRRERLPRGRPLRGLIALGMMGFVGQSLTYFYALRYASPGLVGMLLYLYPTLVAIGSVLFLKERLTTPKTVAVALALLGTTLTAGFGGGQFLGVALALLSGIIYTGYTLVSSRLLRLAAPLPSAAVILGSAAPVYALLLALQGPHWPRSTEGWLAIVGIALISTVIGVGGYQAGIARIGASDAATLSTLEPVVTIILAAVVLDDRPTLLALVGGALIVAAVLVLTRGEMRRVTAARLLDGTS
ncbi:MAG: DMT family transporter [Anaerolineae bacterium]